MPLFATDDDKIDARRLATTTRARVRRIPSPCSRRGVFVQALACTMPLDAANDHDVDAGRRLLTSRTQRLFVSGPLRWIRVFVETFARSVPFLTADDDHLAVVEAALLYFLAAPRTHRFLVAGPSGDRCFLVQP